MKFWATIRNSSYVAIVALLCLAPSALALQNIHEAEADKHKKPCRNDRPCSVAAAEGGSTGLYLLLAGASCLGAMFVNSRREDRQQKAV
jgi:hypothetical protein